MSDIYESKASFRANVDGQAVTVRRGDTVRKGHPLVVDHPEHFNLLVPRFEFTPPPPPKAAPAAPPAKKPAPAALKVPAPAPKKAEE